MSDETIFALALEQPDPAARAAFLAEACSGDLTLRQRVEALLRTHEKLGNFLDKPVVEQMPAVPAESSFTQAFDASTDRKGPTPERTEGGAAGEELADLHFLQPGTRPDSLGRLGHYEVLQVLGKGGFGIVFRAFDDVLQRVVAIKVLAPEMAATSPARKRFLREARSSAQVRHENVVQVYAVEEQPLPYLVMEYIPGETLQERLDRSGPLDVPEVLRIGQQIAEGLAAAHATGIIHRDIKPANVLLESGVRGHVKLTDFGLARAADDASMTQSGVLAGTPMYMSPEQAQGHKLDHRADLFSLGSVLYVMATGRPPFRAANTYAVLKRVVEDDPRPIQEVIPEVPQWLCDIIARLQAKKPEVRIATAREVADLLARGLEALQRAAQSLSLPEAIPAPFAAPLPTMGRGESEAAMVLSPLSPRGRGVGGEGATQQLPDAKAPAELLTFHEPAPAFRSRLRTRSGAVAAAVLLLLVVGLSLTEATGVTQIRSTVIRLFSPEGTLVVEVDDPGVTVQIDGSDIVITGAGAKEIRLKPGSYTVKGIKDGKVVSQELVAVTKDGKQVVRVSLEARPPTPPVEETAEQKAAKLARAKDKAIVAPTVDPDRTAAEYVFSLGGTVKVNEQNTWIKAGADLPRESFRLTTVNLFDRPVTDAQLVVFKDCKNLEELILTGAKTVSDAGLACFKNCQNLTTLDLTRTNVTAEGLAHFGGCTNLASLTISGTMVTDAALASFKDCKNLTKLDLSHTPVTDAGLAHFKDCKNLTVIRLGATQVTDAGMAHFEGCSNLEKLTLDGTQVGDVGLAHFKNCKNLVHLNLFGTQVSDAGLATFGDCKNLLDLELSGTHVGDVGLAHFKDCKNLFHLGLHSTQVSDAGLAYFKDRKQLTWVNLSNTQVSDPGLVHLKDCKNLRGLTLKKSKVTATGIEDLRKSVSRCTIVWDGGEIPPR